MNQSPHIIRRLRSLVPRRTLSHSEAARIAELQANRLREMLGINDAHLPDEAISELPRIRVRQTFDLPVSGLTYWDHGKWVIGLNGSEPVGRRRFSLAHELKHCMDHTTKDWLYSDGINFTKAEKAEHIADYFAGCLLMPKRFVKALHGERKRVSELAAIFEVSTRAMTVRLAQLGLTDPTPRCDRPNIRARNSGMYHRQLSTSLGVAA